MILEIKDLKISVEDKEILKGLNLNINPGEVHALMGPNGSGKSTLCLALVGHPNYKVDSGSVSFKGENLLDKSPEERSLAGLFLAFQYPIEIAGVNNTYFLKAALNAKRKNLGLPELDAIDFLKLVKTKMADLKISEDFLSRSVNEGFSGGEKKRNEALQIALLEPSLAILDETDSGLDIDALKIVAGGINKLRNKDRSFLIVTHYQRLLDYIEPDFVHVLQNGLITQSGDKNLAKELEESGYDQAN